MSKRKVRPELKLPGSEDLLPASLAPSKRQKSSASSLTEAAPDLKPLFPGLHSLPRPPPAVDVRLLAKSAQLAVRRQSAGRWARLPARMVPPELVDVEMRARKRGARSISVAASLEKANRAAAILQEVADQEEEVDVEEGDHDGDEELDVDDYTHSYYYEGDVGGEDDGAFGADDDAYDD